MQLTDEQRAKLDSELLALLESAEDSKVIRAIVSLGPPQSKGGVERTSEPTPRQFASRHDYKRALIDLQQATVKANIGETIEQLRQLDLELEGGCTTHTVIVVGAASNFAMSLKLTGVRRAEFDGVYDLAAAGSPS